MFKIFEKLMSKRNDEEIVFSEKKEYREKVDRVSNDIYLETYKRIKKEIGLENVEITFKLDCYLPMVKMYRECEDKSFVQDIQVFMTRDSIMACYEASLAHELYHVKTNLELIEMIGIEELAKLMRDSNIERSIAFKTLSEYYSWFVAISKYKERKCHITLRNRIWEYKNKRIDEVELCDTIAAQYAWSKAKDAQDIDYDLAEEESQLVKNICCIIDNNLSEWPLSLNQFEHMGTDLLREMKKLRV